MPSAVATAVRTVDARYLLGHYVNTPGELELWLQDQNGEVVLAQKLSAGGVPIRLLKDGRYVAGGLTFGIVPGRSGRQQYLMIAGHALRKVDWHAVAMKPECPRGRTLGHAWDLAGSSFAPFSIARRDI